MSHDLFSRLEQTLEGLVEGVFTRAFRAPLQPIEVGKRLAREMEQRCTVSVSATYVPNHYTVYLATDTFDTFTQLGRQVVTELEQFLREYAEERQYVSVGRITINFVADPVLKPHDVRIEAASEAPRAAVPPPASAVELEHTMLFTVTKPTGLEYLGAGGHTQCYALHHGLTIGRGPMNAVVLSSPSVSRQHAVIEQREGTWIIRDLGSTNGTQANGKRITEHILMVGESLQLGEERFKVV